MSVKNSKLFTVTGGISNEPVTILVETLKPLGGETVVVLEELEGIYDSREEFEDALDYRLQVLEKGYARDARAWKSIWLKIPDAQKLVDALIEVLEASGEG